MTRNRHAARLTLLKSAGLALSLIVSLMIGFVLGIEHSWQTVEKMTVDSVRATLLEGCRDRVTFRVQGMDNLIFYPWADKPGSLTIAGAGDQGMRKVQR